MKTLKTFAAVLITAAIGVHTAYAQTITVSNIRPSHDHILLDVMHNVSGSGNLPIDLSGYIAPKGSGNCPAAPVSFSQTGNIWNPGWRARLTDIRAFTATNYRINVGDNTGAGTGFSTRFQAADNVAIMPGTTYCILFGTTLQDGSARAVTTIAEATTTAVPMPDPPAMPDPPMMGGGGGGDEMTGGDDDENNAAADDAVLPRVVPQINRGIYNRIQQRQREDGRWK